ncbi:M67 family metallopeptidase [Desmospora profundinema]|uniref:Proteasome lid subunit RPN8/RPN11 n=1 Tax=Desmospora profundinema TaxID=1571184 RepID=A0ABU1IMV2_9BACL|nr:M67 family metallopeptidase [Desmospora profundinema]MDR6226111.1 proteasome lid subunit RPN8/RPN11 [Desmospora profundinema]
MASTLITIQARVIQLMEAHCQQELPREACGILAGNGQEITRFFPIPNQDSSPQSFSFEPRAFLEALKIMRREQLEWLGILHSHPRTDPYPSDRDISHWHYPELISWILSFHDHPPRLSAYHIKHGRVVPVLYEVVSGDEETDRLE